MVAKAKPKAKVAVKVVAKIAKGKAKPGKVQPQVAEDDDFVVSG